MDKGDVIMLDFRVETFLCACRCMSFTRAAGQLNITQPAVSQHIRCLEGRYGTKLFEYENKKLRLTPSGKILRDRFITLKNDEKALQQELHEQLSGIEELSLGVTMTVGEYAMTGPLSAYIRQHPQLNLRVRFGNTQQLLRLMGEGSIQLALVEGYYPREDYDSMNYSRENFIGVCAAAHEFSKGSPRTFRDLLGERLLVREAGSGTRNILERNLALEGMEIGDFRRFIEVENMHAIIGMLLRDCGITFLYEIAVAGELREKKLQRIELEDFSMKHEFDFIWEKNSIYGEKYKAFGRELKALAGN